MGYIPEEGLYAQILDDTQGGYPCCSYIDPDDFPGGATEGFICGFWNLEFELSTTSFPTILHAY